MFAFNGEYSVLFETIVIAAIIISIGFVLEKVVLNRLKRIAQRTPWKGDEVIISSLKGFLFIFFVLLALKIALRPHIASPQAVLTVHKIYVVLLIFLVTIALCRMAVRLVRLYGENVSTGYYSVSIFSNLIGVMVFLLGVLVILQYLNISIAPVLGALGVGGLAVALGLQDTLANLFAGLHILAAKQIKLGDYIRLASGLEGFVTDINWRYSKIRALSNNVTIIPNAELSKAVVINYDLPEKEMTMVVEVGVSYASDLEQVERITIEVAKEVLREVPGGVKDFEPIVRYHTFGDFSIIFNVVLRVQSFIDQAPVKHEFIKRLHKRYRAEGIEIPFPIRTVHLLMDDKNRLAS
ncbi:MAG: mechanosensitive ion channel family protein [Syntrophales bacterium]|nr:mechanosensitive ion channel family protein [Syntrophales bacterium]